VRDYFWNRCPVNPAYISLYRDMQTFGKTTVLILVRAGVNRGSLTAIPKKS